MTFKKIRFVTDSTCDIPAELVKRHNITVIPCYINYNDGSFSDDGLALVRDQFYKDLPQLRPYPTTSAMSPGLAEEMITSAAREADHVFILTVASKLSGVYNAMRLGASHLPEGSYTLIDSETLTMGLGFQVLIGAEIAESTNDVAQVEDAILRVRRHQQVYAALESLEFLRRSGRVGWAAAGIGTLLQIKPIIGVRDGEVHSISRVRTFARALDELLSQVDKHKPLDRLAIMYASETDAVGLLIDQLTPHVPTQIVLTRITPTIGVHTGPMGIGVTTLSTAWRA